jgi:hypothetical protein
MTWDDFEWLMNIDLIPDGFWVIAPARFGYLGSTLPASATPAR